MTSFLNPRVERRWKYRFLRQECRYWLSHLNQRLVLRRIQHSCPILNKTNWARRVQFCSLDSTHCPVPLVAQILSMLWVLCRGILNQLIPAWVHSSISETFRIHTAILEDQWDLDQPIDSHYKHWIAVMRIHHKASHLINRVALIWILFNHRAPMGKIL